MSRIRRLTIQVVLAMFVALVASARAGDSLTWNTNKNLVAVDIKDWDLVKLLKKISASTGWRVYMEPGTSAKITATFKDASSDDALKRLMSGLNYTKDTTSNGLPRLLVYRTVMAAAVQAMESTNKDYRIPNELLVQLKRNSTNSIDEIAKEAGAKVLKKVDALHLYELQFPDAASADAARGELADNSSVGMVDANYFVDPPNPTFTPITGVPNLTPQIPSLNSSTPTGQNQLIGLVDTAVQMQNGFSQFSLQPISVVGQPDLPADQISHGTSMFETMVQEMQTDPSKILPVDVYPSGDQTTIMDVVPGIVAAAQSGASIINLSLGGTGDSALLQSVITQGEQAGKTFVAASGNTPGDDLTYPAAYPGVVAITASSSNGQLASYANDGPFVQAMLPGTSIVYLNGQAWQVEGTSTATALASAWLAQTMNQQHISAGQAVSQLIQAYPPPRR